MRKVSSLPYINLPELTPGRAALLGLMDQYLRGSLDPTITLLEVQKLMYFQQAAGEPLQLRYEPGFYGPYATNLRHVLTRLEGHYLTGTQSSGDAPGTPLQILPGTMPEVEQFLAQQPATRHRFERVTDLVEGFETPFGLELLATVHWVAEHETTLDPERVIAAVYAWNDHKQQFSTRQIRLALTVLTQKDGLPADPATPLQ